MRKKINKTRNFFGYVYVWFQDLLFPLYPSNCVFLLTVIGFPQNDFWILDFHNYSWNEKIV